MPIVKEDNFTYYFKDEECTILHRTDGPSIEHVSKNGSWYYNNVFIGNSTYDGSIYLDSAACYIYPILKKLSRRDGFMSKSNFFKFAKLQIFI